MCAARSRTKGRVRSDGSLAFGRATGPLAQFALGYRTLAKGSEMCGSPPHEGESQKSEGTHSCVREEYGSPLAVCDRIPYPQKRQEACVARPHTMRRVRKVKCAARLRTKGRVRKSEGTHSCVREEYGSPLAVCDRLPYPQKQQEACVARPHTMRRLQARFSTGRGEYTCTRAAGREDYVCAHSTGRRE